MQIAFHAYSVGLIVPLIVMRLSTLSTSCLLILLICSCACAIQIPPHWVAYLQHVVKYEEMPTPRHTSGVIASGRFCWCSISSARGDCMHSPNLFGIALITIMFLIRSVLSGVTSTERRMRPTLHAVFVVKQ